MLAAKAAKLRLQFIGDHTTPLRRKKEEAELHAPLSAETPAPVSTVSDRQVFNSSRAALSSALVPNDDIE